jgi:hypothetical protein
MKNYTLYWVLGCLDMILIIIPPVIFTLLKLIVFALSFRFLLYFLIRNKKSVLKYLYTLGIILLISFLLRLLISLFSDINLVTDYLNPISILYYLFMAIVFVCVKYMKLILGLKFLHYFIINNFNKIIPVFATGFLTRFIIDTYVGYIAIDIFYDVFIIITYDIFNIKNIFRFIYLDKSICHVNPSNRSTCLGGSSEASSSGPSQVTNSGPSQVTNSGSRDIFRSSIYSNQANSSIIYSNLVNTSDILEIGKNHRLVYSQNISIRGENIHIHWLDGAKYMVYPINHFFPHINSFDELRKKDISLIKEVLFDYNKSNANLYPLPHYNDVCQNLSHRIINKQPVWVNGRYYGSKYHSDIDRYSNNVSKDTK